MKKTFLTLILVFSAAILFAQKAEYKREITKDFSVQTNAKLSISNIYGNVNIVEGSEGKIAFKIEITGKGKNAETAREYADGVNVDFTSTSNHISAKTELPKMNCNNCGISIDYVVIVPRSTTMDFNMRYGNLTLNDTPKPLKVEILYGNLKAANIADANINARYGNVEFEKCSILNLVALYGDLNATTIEKTNIDTRYGKVIFSTCGEIKINSLYSDIKADVTANTTIDVKYASVEIGTCKDLSLKSMYTDFKFGEILSINAESRYDKFNIKTINDFTITTIYTDIKIDKLNNSFSASKFTYGDLTITNIDKSFSKIKVDNGMYSDFKLGLNEQHNFKANLNAGEYGEIKPGKITFNNVTLSKKDNAIVGTAGKSDNPKAEVSISANYGNIIFK
ncbi:MAG: hypothetical protein LBC68_09290 [Prevotellaceae bacterium]|jgi:hypothetical protein|nr:hypothetical protein [Prevotellaceae bacterium]